MFILNNIKQEKQSTCVCKVNSVAPDTYCAVANHSAARDT